MTLSLSISSVITQTMALSGLHSILSHIDAPALGADRDEALKALIPGIAADMAVMFNSTIAGCEVTDDFILLTTADETCIGTLPLALAFERYLSLRLIAHIWASADKAIAARAANDAATLAASLRSSLLTLADHTATTLRPSAY